MTLCHAKSARTGLPCRQHAISGGTVCVTHGGSAGHVREAARRRLEAMVFPALAVLRKLIDEADGDGVKLAAVKDILDRAGLKPSDLIQVDNTVSIRVSYQDSGIAPVPGRATGRVDGHSALNGSQDH